MSTTNATITHDRMVKEFSDARWADNFQAAVDRQKGTANEIVIAEEPVTVVIQDGGEDADYTEGLAKGRDLAPYVNRPVNIIRSIRADAHAHAVAGDRRQVAYCNGVIDGINEGVINRGGQEA